MFFWNSLAFAMIQWMLAIWSLVPLSFLKPAWTVHILLKPGLENFEHSPKLLSHFQFYATPCSPPVSHQASLFMRFSTQGYWSGLLYPSPGDLPNLDPLHCRQIFYHLSHQGSQWVVSNTLAHHIYSDAFLWKHKLLYANSNTNGNRSIIFLRVSEILNVLPLLHSKWQNLE